MSDDLKESLMMIANQNMAEYDILKRISTEDFIIKYRIFIDGIEAKQNK
jgi:hypothetical protein